MSDKATNMESMSVNLQRVYKNVSTVGAMMSEPAQRSGAHLDQGTLQEMNKINNHVNSTPCTRSGHRESSGVGPARPQDSPCLPCQSASPPGASFLVQFARTPLQDSASTSCMNGTNESQAVHTLPLQAGRHAEVSPAHYTGSAYNNVTGPVISALHRLMSHRL